MGTAADRAAAGVAARQVTLAGLCGRNGMNAADTYRPKGAARAAFTGEGGACLTNDPDLTMRLRMLRGHGMRPERRYWFEVADIFRRVLG
jgi:DegT/DnrJ/EryC1/StrS aminotransferase family